MYMNINCISNPPNIFKHMIMSSQNSLPLQVALQSNVSFPTKKTLPICLQQLAWNQPAHQQANFCKSWQVCQDSQPQDDTVTS